MAALVGRPSQLESHLLSLSELRFLVAQLSSANEAQTSTIARLSSENANLRGRVQEQDRLMDDHARVSVLEELDEENEVELAVERPVDKIEAHPVFRSRHKASMETLPAELTDIILSFLPRADQLRLGRCSFTLLSRASRSIYGSEVVLDFKKAWSFIASRLWLTTSSSPRITSFLTPRRSVTLLATTFPNAQISSLSSLLPPLAVPPFPIKCLTVSERFYPSLPEWSPILWFFDPQLLILDGSNRAQANVNDKRPRQPLRVSRPLGEPGLDARMDASGELQELWIVLPSMDWWGEWHLCAVGVSVERGGGRGSEVRAGHVAGWRRAGESED